MFVSEVEFMLHKKAIKQNYKNTKNVTVFCFCLRQKL